VETSVKSEEARRILVEASPEPDEGLAQADETSVTPDEALHVLMEASGSPDEALAQA
jgi:hypothetical protein